MDTQFNRTWHPKPVWMHVAGLVSALVSGPVLAQVAFPSLPTIIQGVAWTSGTHHVAQSPAIISPHDAGLPVAISAAANAEFVSGTEVRLTDGFHAGSFASEGQFRARIGEQFGDPEAIVLIPSDPGAQVVDGVVHVPKWEKLEIGLELPPVYKEAIDRFFAHYYSNGPNEFATPGSVSAVYDLNPYADDSLQLVMTLTKPDGTQTLKWGFFMREAKWNSETSDVAILIEDNDGPSSPYNMRFRLAPDVVGEWNFAISLKAPYTTSLNGTPLPHVVYEGHRFTCDPPLPDNDGDLRVNSVNKRMLQFESGKSFFGMGPNLADQDGGPPNSMVQQAGLSSELWFKVRHEILLETMEQLHEVGGNFARMYLMRRIFQPEFKNLGVYDQYKAVAACDANRIMIGNCQYQSWAFDRVLDQARATGIYIQLCIDPYSYPNTGWEKEDWGHSPYWLNFIQPYPGTAGNPRDMKRYFYSLDEDGDPLVDSGSFYYWKRKYKYLMSRWGYSVNLAAIEPFNEMDQMLSYRDNVQVNGNCGQNNGLWSIDPDLSGTLDSWLTDLTDYVRGPVVVSDPAHSPLGEDKLFTMSYVKNEVYMSERESFYKPFNNPAVDFMDVHWYAWPTTGQANQADSYTQNLNQNPSDFFNTFPTNGGTKKPFIQGECAHMTMFTMPGWYDKPIERFFHNYEVSFHNEIWAGAFSGKLATGTTWHWARVFWWPNALGTEVPGPDLDNFHQQGDFSNVLGATNVLNVGGIPIAVTNRRIHHHFRPLAELLAHPSWLVYDFFNDHFTAEQFFDNDPSDGLNELEAFYLRNGQPEDPSTVAIGWVHNRNAWVMNGYYARSSQQNFFGCAPPDPSTSSTITLSGFAPEADFNITWFPTHLNSTTHPAAMELTTTATGTLTIDLTGEFGGIDGSYMDTLRSDYAFIITQEPFFKSLPVLPIAEEPSVKAEWDFTVYPNPARDELYIRLPDDAPVDIFLHDPSGRRMITLNSVSGLLQRLPIARLAKGAYYVVITDGEHRKAKKLIIH